MHGNNDSGKRVFDNTAPGGGKINLRNLRGENVTIDDFRDRIKREEERKKNQSSGQGSSK
ncbi:MULTISPECIES: hypothetical protein [Wolbachia]|uniref:Uncharacterized protein n=1 Tax=Wolbachia endosymbiont of Ephestia elutella TaxID=3231696 RepID=A0AAU8MMM0_9RICK|nr:MULTISPECIES: hypothetical protein [Wolbachia]QEK89485.1 hypothetical protein CAI20_01905 [Wolbachia endosymbiont of Chrysomya megacephala]